MDETSVGSRRPPGEAVSGPAAIGSQYAVDRVDDAVEEHRFDPNVVMEPFDVAQWSDGCERMHRELRGGVGGEIDLFGFAHRCDPTHAGDAAATCDVGLEAVDRTGTKQRSEVGQHGGVLAGADLHPGRRAIS